jgi:hypothetical protein
MASLPDATAGKGQNTPTARFLGGVVHVSSRGHCIAQDLLSMRFATAKMFLNAFCNSNARIKILFHWLSEGPR